MTVDSFTYTLPPAEKTPDISGAVDAIIAHARSQLNCSIPDPLIVKLAIGEYDLEISDTYGGRAGHKQINYQGIPAPKDIILSCYQALPKRR